MYLLINIPVSIFNCFFVYLALSSIYQYYSYSEYKPRLIIISLLILGHFPDSITSMLVCLFNKNLLPNSALCYITAFINLLGAASHFSLIMLTIYTLLILFSKLSKRTINKIGYVMIFFILGFVGVIEFIILPYFGATTTFPCPVNGKIVNYYCGINNVKTRAIIFTSLGVISAFICLVSLILFLYFLYFKNLRKGERKYKFFLVFALFSVIESFRPFRLFFEKVLGIQLNQTFKHIFTDIIKIGPGLNSLVYYLVEVYFRKEIKNINLEVILKIDKTRKILKEFLEGKGYRSLWSLLVQWEKIYPEEDKGQYYSLLGYDHFLKEFALKNIEKELEKVLGEFLWHDKFCDYYENLEKMGGTEIDLMMQGKISGKN